MKRQVFSPDVTLEDACVKREERLNAVYKLPNFRVGFH